MLGAANESDLQYAKTSDNRSKFAVPAGEMVI